jgi:hypothetical protein
MVRPMIRVGPHRFTEQDVDRTLRSYRRCGSSTGTSVTRRASTRCRAESTGDREGDLRRVWDSLSAAGPALRCRWSAAAPRGSEWSSRCTCPQVACRSDRPPRSTSATTEPRATSSGRGNTTARHGRRCASGRRRRSPPSSTQVTTSRRARRERTSPSRACAGTTCDPGPAATRRGGVRRVRVRAPVPAEREVVRRR